MSDSISANVSPLPLLGDTRRSALLTALIDLVKAWQQCWSTQRDVIDVKMGEHAARTSQFHTGFVSCVTASSGADQPLLRVFPTANCLPSLLGVAEGGLQIEAAAIAGGIVQELQSLVMHSLCTSVLTRCAIADIAIEDTPCTAPFAEQRGWWQIDLQLDSGRPLLCLLLHSRLVELLAPRRPRAAPVPIVLERKRTAVADELVRVEAVLGELEVTLLDLASLAEGDVLLLDQPLTQPGFLTMQNGTRLASIYLGSTTPYRAVRVDK